MNKYLLIFLFLYVDVIISKNIGTSYDKYQIIKLTGMRDVTSEDNLLTMLKLPQDTDVEILHGNAIEGTAQLLVKPQLIASVLQEVLNQKFTYEVLVEDLGRMIYTSSLQRSNDVVLEGNATFERYMNFKEIEEYLKNIEKLYPDKLQVNSIGKSFENRDIYMVTISDQTRRLKDQTKPIVFVEAGIHAREWITMSSAMYLIEKLLETPEFTRNLEWRIVPVTNPDGYVNTWTNNRMWRKNMNTNEGKSCVGVDLNRNFDSHWLTRGASSSPCSQVHAGSTAFSEKESQSIRDAILEVSSRVKAYVSVHSYGQLILHPPGVGLFDITEEQKNLLSKVGTKMSSAILKTTSAAYTVGSPEDILYAAAGLSMDWALEKAKIPLAFTYEMRDLGRGGFLLPETEIRSTVEDLWTGIQVLAKEIPLLDVKEENTTLSSAVESVLLEKPEFVEGGTKDKEELDVASINLDGDSSSVSVDMKEEKGKKIFEVPDEQVFDLSKLAITENDEKVSLLIPDGFLPGGIKTPVTLGVEDSKDLDVPS